MKLEVYIHQAEIDEMIKEKILKMYNFSIDKIEYTREAVYEDYIS